MDVSAGNGLSLTVEDTLLELNIDSRTVGDGAGRAVSPGNYSQDSQDSCHMEEAEARGKMEVVVRKADLNRTNSAEETGMPEYRYAQLL